jgi:hypothetical protein
MQRRSTGPCVSLASDVERRRQGSFPAGARPVVAALVVLAVAACGTDRQGTEDRAAEEARTTAQAVQDALLDVVEVPGPPTGNALLSAVQAQVQDSTDRIYVFGSELVDEDVVHLDVAFDGFDESGGGGSAYQFLARLCVEYEIRSGEDPGVTVSDTRCSEDLLEPTGPTHKADRTIGLED